MKKLTRVFGILLSISAVILYYKMFQMDLTPIEVIFGCIIFVICGVGGLIISIAV